MISKKNHIGGTMKKNSENRKDGNTDINKLYEELIEMKVETWKKVLEGQKTKPSLQSLFPHLEQKAFGELNLFSKKNLEKKEKIICNISGAIDFLYDYYSDTLEIKRIDDYLNGVKKALKQKKLEYDEEKARSELTDMRIIKDWFTLAKDIPDLYKGEHSQEFTDYLKTLEEEAHNGVKWRHFRDELKRQIEWSYYAQPDEIMGYLKKRKAKIRFLEDNQEKYGGKKEIEQWKEFPKKYYLKMNQLLEQKHETEDKLLEELERIEQESRAFFPPPPTEWQEKKKRLKNQLKQLLDKYYSKSIKNNKHPDQLNEEFKKLLAKANYRLVIPEYDKFVDSHRNAIDKIKSASSTVDNFPKAFKVEYIKNSGPILFNIEKDMKEIEEIAGQWTTFKELKNKHSSYKSVISKALKIQEKIEDLLQSLEEQPVKLLLKKKEAANLDSEAVKALLNSIEQEISKLSTPKTENQLLNNLKQLVIGIRQVIFKGKTLDKSEHEIHYFMEELIKKIQNGYQLVEQLKNLTLTKTPEPSKLLRQFREIVETTRGRHLVLSVPAGKTVMIIVDEIVGKITFSIEARLREMEKTLTIFYPLTAQSTLQEYENKIHDIQKLRTELKDIFGEILTFIEASEEQLEQLQALIRLGRSIHSKQYNEVTKHIQDEGTFSKELRAKIKAFLYFHQNLESPQWSENRWFEFFEYIEDDFNILIRHEDFKRIITRFENLFEQNFLNLSPESLIQYNSVFSNQLSKSFLSPYVQAISGKQNISQLMEKIRKEDVSEETFFSTFIEYLKKYQLWPVLVQIYRTPLKDAVTYFGNEPLEDIHRELGKQYHLIKESFHGNKVDQQGMKTFKDSIPADLEFEEYKKQHETLSILGRNIQRIREMQEIFSTEGGSQADLKEFEKLCRTFTGDFEALPEEMKWNETISTLKNRLKKKA
jgi:hypothetical protein